MKLFEFVGNLTNHKVDRRNWNDILKCVVQCFTKSITTQNYTHCSWKLCYIFWLSVVCLISSPHFCRHAFPNGITFTRDKQYLAPFTTKDKQIQLILPYFSDHEYRESLFLCETCEGNKFAKTFHGFWRFLQSKFRGFGLRWYLDIRCIKLSQNDKCLEVVCFDKTCGRISSRIQNFMPLLWEYKHRL